MAGLVGATTTRRRVVLFPFPFRSHITPTLQLAGLLRARGLAVTVLHTDFNAPDAAARFPGIDFVSIRESLPAEVADPDADIVDQMVGLNGACKAPFEAALASLPDAACAVVVDGQWYAMLGAAKAAGVPSLALRTDSAATFHSMLADPRVSVPGYSPMQEDKLDKPVPGLEPLRGRDLIRIDGSDTAAVSHFIDCVNYATRALASGVVVNTFAAVEAAELAKIQGELSRPAFGVGPLHLLSPSPVEHGLHAPDRGCLAWLDAQPPRSVLYASLGSIARVDRALLEEMAWGLAGSGVPFLWVVRPGSVSGGTGEAALPEGLASVLSRTGKVVPWAPQREVLAHPAVGGFWTHCGWNSTLEAVCEGVPMLVQPCFADQTVNARYVTHQWGVGLELGAAVQRAAVADAVRRLMAGEEGAAARARASDLKAEARRCVAAGGSASVAIDNLVQYISSL